jgi:hypothetical protein
VRTERLNSFANVDSKKESPSLGVIEHRQKSGSSSKSWELSLLEKCCVDPLSRHDLSRLNAELMRMSGRRRQRVGKFDHYLFAPFERENDSTASASSSRISKKRWSFVIRSKS